MNSDVSDKFEKAKVELNTLKNDPGNEVKLKMYALFKQVRLLDFNGQEFTDFDNYSITKAL